MKKCCLILLCSIGLSPIVSFGQISDTTAVKKQHFTSILSLTRSNIINKLSIENNSADLYDRAVSVKSPSLAHTAFFCKIEDKIGKSANLPLKMRLGDIDYVDAIEGKRVIFIPRQ